MATEQKISETLARAAPAQETCRALVDLALQGGGKDNVTVVLARYRIPRPGRKETDPTLKLGVDTLPG
jgi:serine/threonine protein phosphatase PrpC